MEQNKICRTNEQIAVRATVSGVLLNIFLALFKFILGFVTGSGAMISDGVHSVADVFSAVIVIIGLKMSAKEADERHPYGHGRFECIAAIILSAVLFVTGVGIGKDGIMGIISGQFSALGTPGVMALIAALIPIVAKNLMYHYMISAARRVKSEALKAEAWHHRTDSLSSIGGLIGMAGAQFGAPILDSIACVVICVFIVRTACQIFIEAVGKLIDEACDEETERAMRDIALHQEGVTDVLRVRTRKFGSGMCADIEVAADGDMQLSRAGDISASLQETLMQKFCSLEDCVVSVAPSEEADD